MDNLKIVDAGLDGSVTFELLMAPSFSNLNGNVKSSYVYNCHF